MTAENVVTKLYKKCHINVVAFIFDCNIIKYMDKCLKQRRNYAKKHKIISSI